MSSAIILFAHGSRDPTWAAPFERLRALVAQRQPQALVMLAYLESMQPSLDDAVAQAAAQGTQEALIVPLFLAAGSHLKSDLPRMVAQLEARFPGLTLRVLPPIGENEMLLQAMADWIAAQ